MFTANIPVAANIGKPLALRFTAAPSSGGSAVSDITAVAVSPARSLPSVVAMMLTDAAKRRMPALNSSCETGKRGTPSRSFRGHAPRDQPAPGIVADRRGSHEHDRAADDDRRRAPVDAAVEGKADELGRRGE